MIYLKKKVLITKFEYEWDNKAFSSFCVKTMANTCFAEGNTRTTAVFFIKYLKTLGFEVGNELFSEHSWYFRNALVRANYNDLKKWCFWNYRVF